jgi:predicted porin
MKKKVIALGILGGLTGALHAQTSVSIYGSVDGGIRHRTNVNAAGDSLLTVGSTGTYNSNRLGFRGVEDLGAGMNAHFTLESGFNSGTGALDNTVNTLWNRQAFVGIGGTWGALDLGRQYTIGHTTNSAYDPFAYKYTGILPAAGAAATAGVRNNNAIKYTGTFGPFTLRALYGMGEQAGSVSDGSTQAVGAAYVAGPLNVGAAYTKRKLQPGTAGFYDNDHYTVGGGFRTGPFRILVGYTNEEQDSGTAARNSTTRNAWLGGTYNITEAFVLTAAYYDTKLETATATGKRELAMIGATYAMSKRTNLYAEVDVLKLEGVARTVSQDRQRGISMGINHFF